MREVCRPAGRSLPGPLAGARERKVRAPQDAVVGNAHRPQGPGKCNRKHTAWRVVRGNQVTTHHAPGKGEKVGGLWSLNVRAHQQPGDRLARQTPPGARPNKGAGLVRPVTTLG